MRRDDAEFFACPIPFPTNEWRGQVLRGVDADTVTAKIDRGWFDTSRKEFRFALIDAYEQSTALGKRCTVVLRERLEGRWVKIVTRMDAEKYGRILATFWYWGDDAQLHCIDDDLRGWGCEKARIALVA
jgi:endonuclease YncB( thermonuclease family)